MAVMWDLVSGRNFNPVGNFMQGYQGGQKQLNEREKRAVLAEIARMGPDADLNQAAMRVLPYDPQTGSTLAQLGMRKDDQAFRQQTRAEDVAHRDRAFASQQDYQNRSLGLRAQEVSRRQENTTESRAVLAQKHGLDPNSAEGRAFILTGNLPPNRQARVPVGIQNAEAMDIEAVQSLGTINSELDRFGKLIKSGALPLGAVANAMAAGRNMIGASDEASRNLASFRATLEKMRNDSLRLNKGVQTEGDSQRAWNELVANINDPQVVTQRLAEIQRLNTIAANFKRNMIMQRRDDNNLSPLDLDRMITAPSGNQTMTPAPMSVDPNKGQSRIPQNVNPQQIMQEAQDAISRGADPAAVQRRLREMGFQ